jgi:flagellar motility protein MotE (MotC chaperone)
MKPLFEKIRLLPILIVLGGLILTVKVGGLIDGISKAPPAISVATSVEAQQPNPVQPKPAPTSASQAPADQAPSGDTAPANPEVTQPPVASSALSSRPIPSGEPVNYTPAELEVLQKLSARRDELDARAKEMQMREDMAKAAEARLAKKLAEMKQVQSTIEALLRKYDEQEDAKMRSLVKIYESMKPKDAAKIFEGLDMPILLDVIERMKEKKAADVLANVTPQKAKEITFELAERRKLPKPNLQTGG